MSDSLPVMEIYPTFQGEGRYTGEMAWFLRLQGCDVGCVWCDVRESWEMDASKNMPINHIIEKIESLPIKVVVITGGEPTLYDLTALTDALHEAGYTVHLETAGTNEMLGKFDWITLSPKKFKAPLNQNFDQADELKVVIYHPSDLEWAQQMADSCNEETLLFMQPEWSKNADMVPIIVEFCSNHPKWKLSLQTHKYVGMP